MSVGQVARVLDHFMVSLFWCCCVNHFNGCTHTISATCATLTPFSVVSKKDVWDLERRFYLLKSKSESSKFDLKFFNHITSPPLPLRVSTGNVVIVVVVVYLLCCLQSYSSS